MLCIAAPLISPWCNTLRIVGRGPGEIRTGEEQNEDRWGDSGGSTVRRGCCGTCGPGLGRGVRGHLHNEPREGSDSSTWTVTPCASDPEQKDFIPCVHVADSGTSSNAPWQADAHLSVGYWDLAVERSDAVSCDDGTKLAARVKYWWNAVSLKGALGFYFPGGCGEAQAGSLSEPFTLTRIGPPPAIE